MDGFKRRLSESLQLKLSLSLSLAVSIVALIAGSFSFLAAFDEAHELQDDTLRQISALFDRQHLPLAHLGDTGRAKDSDEESLIIVEYLDEGGKVSRNGAGAALALPTHLSDGLYTLDVGGEAFRVLVKTTDRGERIAVAQETALRDELARNGALRTSMPLLILIPILLLLVAYLVRKMFGPVAVVAKEIDHRVEQDLDPIDEMRLPIEVRPFVIAINRLLVRVSRSMMAQRRFVADAAHELRSPVTAMSLQAERLAESEMSAVARQRLATLRRGIERGRNLLDQLLTLAKVQGAENVRERPVSVQGVYRRVLEDLMPLAVAKHIDIGLEGAQDAEIFLSELDLTAVVKNLVDNAIRYTPDGGRIDLFVSRENRGAVLHVKDSGPGIPAGERHRVFDPFYRTLGSDQTGSGLGLSIVKAISDRIDAEVRLAYSDERNESGLHVSVLVRLEQCHQRD